MCRQLCLFACTARALASEHKLTADSELKFPNTWLTPAGFDWELWNASSTFGRDPPGSRTDSMLGSGSDRITVSLTRERVRWMLALGAIPSGGELAAFSMGSTCEFTPANSRA